MPLIPQSVVDEIQQRADIAELIGRYVPLKRAGRHFKASCPFHKERTPSFTVNTDKQIFHCFGCKIGGNVFSFLMQHDRLTFPEAVRQVADQVGVRFPDRAAAPSGHTHEGLVELTEKICAYFERWLAGSPRGDGARRYLKERGVSDRARQLFRLGLAPAGWDHLVKAAGAKGVASSQLEAAGLIIKGQAGYYDRFRNRLIFPIMDIRGRVIGFGGRGLDGQEPKYLNSPETALYSKGRHLFGLAQAKDAVMKTRSAVVVEGYFDCVVLADAGVSNVVSPLGTALTPDQVRLLKRYAERVILAFDADAAGELATLRGVDLLVESGMQVLVAPLPAGIDPDECIRAHGREWFERLLDRSLGVFEFLIQSALRRHPIGGAEETVQAAQFVLPSIAKVPDAMLRSEYIRLLADRLQLDERAVAQELAKARPRPSPGEAPMAKPVAAGQAAIQGPERLLTALVLDDPVRWKQVKQQIFLEEVSDPTLRRMLSALDEFDREGRVATAAQLVSRLSEEGAGGFVASLVELAQTVSAKEAALEDCIRRLRGNSRRRRLAAMRERIRAAQQAGQEQDVQRLVAEYQQQLSAPRGG